MPNQAAGLAVRELEVPRPSGSDGRVAGSLLLSVEAEQLSTD